MGDLLLNVAADVANASSDDEGGGSRRRLRRDSSGVLKPWRMRETLEWELPLLQAELLSAGRTSRVLEDELAVNRARADVVKTLHLQEGWSVNGTRARDHARALASRRQADTDITRLQVRINTLLAATTRSIDVLRRLPSLSGSIQIGRSRL
jgi:hypothetical protein